MENNLFTAETQQAIADSLTERSLQSFRVTDMDSRSFLEEE